MKIQKVKKLAADLHDKTEYAMHRRISKQAFFEYMKSDLRKKAKSDFEKKKMLLSLWIMQFLENL